MQYRFSSRQMIEIDPAGHSIVARSARGKKKLFAYARDIEDAAY